MRSIIIYRELSHKFQDDPVDTFAYLLDRTGVTSISLENVVDIVGRDIAMPDFNIDLREFKLLFEDLNDFHTKAREVPDRSFYITGDVDSKIIDACRQYKQHTRAGDYMDAYRQGLFNILEVMREDADYDEMVEYNDITQNANIFHAIFMMVSSIDRQGN